MHFIITDAWMAKSRAIHLTGTKLVLVLLLATFLMMLTAAGLYHWVFLKGAREGWPIVGTLVRFVIRDEMEQRDRYVRENIDLMARKLGEVQVKLMQLDALGERVAGLAGVSAVELKVKPGSGGALLAAGSLDAAQMRTLLTELELHTDQRVDWLTVVESRLFDQKIRKMMIPTQQPVIEGSLGSPFGWRVDPISGQSALHTGMDFQADPGTAILAAAGGIVVVQEFHSAYGHMIEVDHGNGLITRYAHASRVFVKKGDLIKRGQKLAEVGSSGRSTGPHLHFEVLVQGVPQDPQKFLAAGRGLAALASAPAGSGAAPARRP